MRDNESLNSQDITIKRLIKEPHSIIFLIAIIFFNISLIFGLYQLKCWIETAKWPFISLHQSLAEFGFIDPYFYFDIPDKLGFEKILNSILFSSAPFIYFSISAFLFIIYLMIDGEL